MQQSLLDESTDSSFSALNADASHVTLDTLTVSECRHLPPTHPLTTLLLDSPSSNLRRPRVLIDYLICIAVNTGISYGIAYALWCHNAPTPPPELSSSPYLPVPVLSPFASQQGYGEIGRGSLLIDNLITTLIMTTLLTLIQGAALQLAVGMAQRPPIHPALVGRPLSYFTLWQHSGVVLRVLYTLLQFAVPWILLSLVAMVVLCAGVGGGLGECAVEAKTAVWLKVVWCVPFVATMYPLLTVAATNVRNVSDRWLQRYIDKVRKQHEKGDIDMAA